MKGSARRAEALRELARLLESGLDGGRALASLAPGAGAAGGGDAPRPGLVDGLQAAGLLTAREAAFVAAVEAAGRVDAGLVHVAADLERRARIERRLRSGLVLPLAVVVVAAFAAPAPALARGAVDASGYLQAVAAVLLPVFAGVWLGARHGARAVDALSRLLLRLGRPPTLGQRQRLFAALGRMLESGLDAAGALRAMVAAERAPLAGRLEGASEACAAGVPVVDALRRCRLLAPDGDATPLEAGEAAGRLSTSLRHRADRLGEHLERRAALAGEWLPRAIYGLAAAWAAVRVL